MLLAKYVAVEGFFIFQVIQDWEDQLEKLAYLEQKETEVMIHM